MVVNQAFVDRFRTAPQPLGEVYGIALGRRAETAAHHGSAGSTTTEFLQQIAPAAAVVSAGLDDPFGHPSPPTLERLAAAGVDLWRTDRDGEVTVRTDGQLVELSSFSGRRRRWAGAPRER